MYRKSAFVALTMLATACVSPNPEARSGVQVATGSVHVPASQESIQSLPPQTLDTGECGLFFWTLSQPHQFVVFEHENQRRVQIVHNETLFTMTVVPQETDYIQGVEFERVYQDQESSLSFQISGVIGATSAAGPVIDRAILRVRQLNGTQTVTPLTGLRSCRTNAPILVPSRN